MIHPCLWNTLLPRPARKAALLSEVSEASLESPVAGQCCHPELEVIPPVLFLTKFPSKQDLCPCAVFLLYP